MSAQLISYFVRKARYDSGRQLLLDALKLVGIRIYLHEFYREGLALLPEGKHFQPCEDCRIGLADHEDIDKFGECPDRRVPLSSLHSRLDGGDLCMAAWVSGEMVAFTWADLHFLVCRGHRVSLRDNQAYLHDAYTLPEGRGRGLAVSLRVGLYDLLAKQGRNELFSASERFNSSAIRLKEKLGAESLGSAMVVEFFGRWTLRKPASLDAFLAGP